MAAMSEARVEGVRASRSAIGLGAWLRRRVSGDKLDQLSHLHIHNAMTRSRFFSQARRFEALAWGDLTPSGCKYAKQPARRFQSSLAASVPAAEKPFYVTSPIFYVNAGTRLALLRIAPC